tara:strand:+ start:2521 stop:2784 length:264 start_codon:yes stop_codon:yes gene_type:complete
MLVDILTATGCDRCQKAKALVRRVVDEMADDSIQYREINVVEEIDYAVKLGVLAIPAIAIDGKLIFPALPSASKLRRAILASIDHVQ